MSLSNQDQTQIRQYLLGHLSAEEQEKIEERLMVDDQLFEEFEVSKDELIEEYAAGDLTQPEREWFESHLLASPEGRQRYVASAALGCIKQPIPAPRRQSWFERLKEFFTTHTGTLGLATAAVVILALAGVWFTRNDSRTTVSFALTNTAARRGSSDTPIYRIKKDSGVGELRISLLLPDGASHDVRYRVALDDGRNTKPVKVTGQDEKAVNVSIPAADVPVGYYALKVFSISPAGIEQQLPGDYRFIME